MFTLQIDTIGAFESRLVQELRCELLESPSQEVGEWQAQESSIPTMELQHVILQMPIPDAYTSEALAERLGANLPWAEDHFQERVSGQSLNPAPSEAWWPYAQQGNVEHKKGEIFSHTYPERIWPKLANPEDITPGFIRWGIRYGYGDLADVIKQLRKNPMTRQAYLPIWFPEDTGAVSGQRVPCTLGYHFLYRNGRLDVTYFIRSCDFIRHFRDDLYMAMRLCEWVAWNANLSWCGNLIMHIGSLHAFEPDRYAMEQEKLRVAQENISRLMRSL